MAHLYDTQHGFGSLYKLYYATLSPSVQVVMGENEYKKGLWTAEEDKILIDYIREHGQGRWNRISKTTGDRISSLSLFPPPSPNKELMQDFL